MSEDTDPTNDTPAGGGVATLADRAREVAGTALEKAGPALDRAKELAGQAMEKAGPAFDKAKDAAGSALMKAQPAIEKAKGSAGEWAERLKGSRSDDTSGT
jgi:hypothetical protein